jgi:hypothetical protein
MTYTQCAVKRARKGGWNEYAKQIAEGETAELYEKAINEKRTKRSKEKG